MFSHDVVIGQGMYEGFVNGGMTGNRQKKSPRDRGDKKLERHFSVF
jgi:hypothetical protein